MIKKENSNIFIPKLLKSAFKIEEDIDLSMNTKSIRETSKDVTKFKNYCIYIYIYIQMESWLSENSFTFLDRKSITLLSILSTGWKILMTRAFTSLALGYVKYE